MSTDSELLCLAQIREAIGDDGKLMQSDLVERIREIMAELDRAYDRGYSDGFRDGSTNA